MSLIMIIAGGIQVILGLLRTGKLIGLISEIVIIGFLNGLGVVIGMTQIDSFREACGADHQDECEFIKSIELLFIILMTVGTFFFILFAPKIPKIGKHLPVAMIAIIFCTLINYFGPKTKTVGDVKKADNFILKFAIPRIDEEVNFNLILTLILRGIEYAFVGLIESLLTVLLLDEITKSRGNLD